MRTITIVTIALGLMAAPASTAELRVVTTLSVFADLVSTIGGDHVKVEHVAAPKFNPHFIQPKPSDVLRVKRSDLFVHAGLDLELWRGPLLVAAGNSRAKPGGQGELDLSRGVRLLEVPDRTLSRSEGDIHLYGNPHYWMDPENAIVIAGAIAAKLSDLDPGHEADYNANRDALIERIRAKILQWRSLVAAYAGSEVIGYHNSWPYLMEFLGLRMEHFLEPKPGVPPGPRQLDFLTKHAAKNDIHVIVQSNYYADRAGKTLAKRIRGQVVALAQNVGESKTATDYITMMDDNVRALTDALGGS